MAEVPGQGPIRLTVKFDVNELLTGEQLIISEEIGISLQEFAEIAKEAKGEMSALRGFDIARFNYALGRIGLRRQYGRDADIPENAERVLLVSETVDPTPAADPK